MEQQSVLDAIEPSVWRRMLSRRSAIKAGAAAGVAVGTVPMIIGAMAKEAFAQSGNTQIVAVLNFALTLEHLEDEFYRIATGRTALPSQYSGGVSAVGQASTPRAVFEEISRHESAHVALLQQTITGLGGTPVAKPTFDFTGGSGATNNQGRYTGPFADVFSNPATFLAVSQAFEDTGVRAYKGGVGALAGNVTVLEAALQIHAIEARHAAKVRRLRGEKGWVSGAGTTNVPTQAQAVYGAGSPAGDYPAESNTTHATVNVANLATASGTVGATAASEAFDEPLDVTTVTNIAALFIRP